MTSNIAPYYADGQITLYQAQTPVALPVRKPTDAERAALGPAPKGTPYPHAPFLTAQDESVEVHFVLSNIDTVAHNVWLLIDPWNEFVRWKPGVTVVSDEETIPNNGYDKEYVLGPMSRVEGTITSDDIQEIATKLAAVENFLASPQGMQTDSTIDGQQPRPDAGLQQHLRLPEPIELDPARPLLYAVDPTGRRRPDGLRPRRADGVRRGRRRRPPRRDGADAGPAGDIAVEITMDVQDLNGNRFVPQDTTDPELGMPAEDALASRGSLLSAHTARARAMPA